MKKRGAKKKGVLTRERLVMLALGLVMLAVFILALCFLFAMRTNSDNANNGLLLGLFALTIFALVMIAYAVKSSLNSNAASHEEKTSLSIGGDNGIGINHEEKTATQDSNA